MGLGGSARWKPERAGEFHISRAKMLTDRLCKHTLINTILQTVKNRTAQSHRNPRHRSPPPNLVSFSSARLLCDPNFCTSFWTPSLEYSKASKNAEGGDRGKWLVTIFHLSLKTGCVLQAAESGVQTCECELPADLSSNQAAHLSLHEPQHPYLNSGHCRTHVSGF